MVEYRTVLRPIPSAGEILETGTVVDVSSWRTTQQLIRAGRLSKDKVDKPVVARKKRVQISDEMVSDEETAPF